VTEEEEEEFLYYLRELPGYRELIKQRIQVARKKQILKEQRIWQQIEKQHDIDHLGREVEGCG
jgi:hypothetical protein